MKTAVKVFRAFAIACLIVPTLTTSIATKDAQLHEESSFQNGEEAAIKLENLGKHIPEKAKHQAKKTSKSYEDALIDQLLYEDEEGKRSFVLQEQSYDPATAKELEEIFWKIFKVVEMVESSDTNKEPIGKQLDEKILNSTDSNKSNLPKREIPQHQSVELNSPKYASMISVPILVQPTKENKVLVPADNAPCTNQGLTAQFGNPITNIVHELLHELVKLLLKIAYSMVDVYRQLKDSFSEVNDTHFRELRAMISTLESYRDNISLEKFREIVLQLSNIFRECLSLARYSYANNDIKESLENLRNAIRKAGKLASEVEESDSGPTIHSIQEEYEDTDIPVAGKLAPKDVKPDSEPTTYTIQEEYAGTVSPVARQFLSTSFIVCTDDFEQFLNTICNFVEAFYNCECSEIVKYRPYIEHEGETVTKFIVYIYTPDLPATRSTPTEKEFNDEEDEPVTILPVYSSLQTHERSGAKQSGARKFSSESGNVDLYESEGSFGSGSSVHRSDVAKRALSTETGTNVKRHIPVVVGSSVPRAVMLDPRFLKEFEEERTKLPQIMSKPTGTFTLDSTDTISKNDLARMRSRLRELSRLSKHKRNQFFTPDLGASMTNQYDTIAVYQALSEVGMDNVDNSPAPTCKDILNNGPVSLPVNLPRETIVDAINRKRFRHGNFVVIDLNDQGSLYGMLRNDRSSISFQFLEPENYYRILRRIAQKVYHIRPENIKDGDCQSLLQQVILSQKKP